MALDQRTAQRGSSTTRTAGHRRRAARPRCLLERSCSSAPSVPAVPRQEARRDQEGQEEHVCRRVRPVHREEAKEHTETEDRTGSEAAESLGPPTKAVIDAMDELFADLVGRLAT